ncbi:MAG: hypothetical protein A3I75_07640 [Deltaproteobacteria bacterium RIFCSPLOWO2_02_FULL_50_16]|nr:MAG: hypothetical protein A3B79_06980 [Deltaproteobacteria bacterium RIFCSPHIGHO2_02_FULL_50_15]OGQ57590.1 MAG: hypothetical protein A3I75_07640 [Deltaproteobacteria bacterium RIFCSPLOWO2_02_FULL_50_16]OGQ67005.1 MAG: hypothetical protein A3F89_02285 [Deltaproteobacteria bacterium RIFCSPLOWO2_12_FULL_50_11]
MLPADPSPTPQVTVGDLEVVIQGGGPEPGGHPAGLESTTIRNKEFVMERGHLTLFLISKNIESIYCVPWRIQ